MVSDDGFEIPDILTNAGVMQMDKVMMNEGSKGHAVDVVVVVEQKGIQHHLPNQDGLRPSSEQLVEVVLPVESELRR